MKKTGVSIFVILLLVSISLGRLSTGCKQSYAPPAVSTDRSYLVVEGFIQGGTDTTNIRLSHTFQLSDTSYVTPENNADVQVEGKDNTSFPLYQTGNGNYQIPYLPLQTGVQYRLHIRTSAQKEYVSDYVDIRNSPPIDSVNWIRGNDGVQIYANTHDPQNATRYYRWSYEETWEFNSTFFASLTIQNGQIVNLNPNTIFDCWKSFSSSNIIIASSARLAQDEIYREPLLKVPAGSQQISVKYSLLVKQYPLTQDAYAWWQEMLKNTEQIGSIFGIMPTGTKGNLHCLTDSAELVIGYISAGSAATKRIFISSGDVPNWGYTVDCKSRVVPSDSVGFYISSGYDLIDMNFRPPGYNMAYGSCVDCTLTGSNKRPYYWP
ncbi:DUF4249 domain-containing protein [Flavitalea flava]